MMRSLSVLAGINQRYDAALHPADPPAFPAGTQANVHRKPVFAKVLGAAPGVSTDRSVRRMGFLSNLFGGGDGPSLTDDQKKARMEVMRKGRGCKPAPDSPPEGLEYATVAGGCFWGVELAYQRIPGVIKTAVGYTQGEVEAPTYEMVCSGMTGHTEAVLVTYDPKECAFGDLLKKFEERVDMTQVNRQGGDVGTQYRTGVYYHTEAQKVEAEAFFEAKRAKGVRVASECKPATTFYVAEEYHQQYLEKGGRFGMGQSAAKGCTDKIRCYG